MVISVVISACAVLVSVLSFAANVWVSIHSPARERREQLLRRDALHTARRRDGTAYFTTNRSQVTVGSLLSAGDENPADTLVQMSGTVNQLSSVQIMRRRQNTRGALNHIRVQRFASNGSDTGPTLGFLGLVLVRST